MPRTGCISSWLFPERLFNLKKKNKNLKDFSFTNFYFVHFSFVNFSSIIFFYQFQSDLCLKLHAECALGSFIHFKAVVCAGRLNKQRSLWKSGSWSLC